MKPTFKPLGLATAVATATAGYSGTALALEAERSLGNLGDLAIVPYYTVQDGWVTGVHIINSSEYTQVVKLRLRRATDSADVLDINLVMSPKDEWVGSLNDNGTDGKVTWTAGANQDGVRDTTCTVPLSPDGRFEMRSAFPDSDEGYIEIIGMGTPNRNHHGDDTDGSPIAWYAEHVPAEVDGVDTRVPRDCESVASNFFENLALGGTLDTGAPGNLSNSVTAQSFNTSSKLRTLTKANSDLECFNENGNPINVGIGVCINHFWRATDDALTVSYFIRDADTGIEFGGNAVHIAGASDTAWMTNQQTGITSLPPTPFGVDFPDLGGGPWFVSDPDGDLAVGDVRGGVFPAGTPDLGLGRIEWDLYNQLRRRTLLGVGGVLNDWSMAAARGVSTDWVLTLPGQYNMIDWFVWFTELFDTSDCGTGDVDDDDAVPLCDFRDIPVGLELTIYDREEGEEEVEDPDLIISPAPTVPGVDVELVNEVNVIEWTDGNNTPVLGSEYAITVNPKGLGLGESGWAFASVVQDTKDIGWGERGNLICQFNPLSNLDLEAAEEGDIIWDTDQVRDDVCHFARGSVPLIGFVAWERVFETNPEGNYGRLIDHSFVSSEAFDFDTEVRACLSPDNGGIPLGCAR